MRGKCPGLFFFCFFYPKTYDLGPTTFFYFH